MYARYKVALSTWYSVYFDLNDSSFTRQKSDSSIKMRQNDTTIKTVKFDTTIKNLYLYIVVEANYESMGKPMLLFLVVLAHYSLREIGL